MTPSLNMLAIEVTKLCDMKCVMCVSHGEGVYQGQADDQPPFLDLGLFKSIIDQYVELEPDKYVRTVTPQFQGEPLLNPRFLEYCEIIEKSGTSFGFTTNGTKLTPELAKELVKFKHLNNVCFSIDGASKEVYESIRILGRYPKVMRNINNFLGVLEKAQPLRPPLQTSVSFTEQPLNEHETDQMIKQWVDKADFVSINNVAVKGRPSKFFFKPKERIPCGDLWSYMVVLTDGKVAPCCRDYLYESELGNLSKQSLREVWFGPEYERMRKLHLAGQWDEIPICQDCDTWMCRTPERQVSFVESSIKVEAGPFFRTARRVSNMFDSALVFADTEWKRGDGSFCDTLIQRLGRIVPVYVIVPDQSIETALSIEAVPFQNFSNITIVHVGKYPTPAQRQIISLALNMSKKITPQLWILNPDFSEFVIGCYSPHRTLYASKNMMTPASDGSANSPWALVERLLEKVDLLVCDTVDDLNRFRSLHKYSGQYEILDQLDASPDLAAAPAPKRANGPIWLKAVSEHATSTQAGT